MMHSAFVLGAMLLSSLSFAKSVPVIADLPFLTKVGAKLEAKSTSLNVGFARITERQQIKLFELSHAAGRCGGFEAISESELSITHASKVLEQLEARVKEDERVAASLRPLTRAIRPEIAAALPALKADNIAQTVNWLSSYPSRYNKLPNPNVHVVDFEAKLKAMLAQYPGAYTIGQISHQRTRQNSLRLRLEGKSRPQEIVVLGGHLDSLSGFYGSGSRAPGADDNASGSASLLEALRVLITQGIPERSVEFFWYAGEESGLLGSAEIAQQYKAAQKDVVAVLQLDMTSFPGSGELVVGNVSDFTSPWLRQYLVSINSTYALGARLIDDRCGYACSDHASWYRQGYPTLMPFESDTDNMNDRIHTEGDVIAPLSFTHSLVFAKIALVIAMDLGNSVLRAPSSAAN